jgi:hypothetical protein
VFEVFDVLGTAGDHRRWRDDWDRTWSPVSLLFALIALGTLIAVAWVYWADVWRAAVAILR